VMLDPQSLLAHETLSSAYAADHQQDAAMVEYQTAEHLYETVHPEFQSTEFAPEKPGAQK